MQRATSFLFGVQTRTGVRRRCTCTKWHPSILYAYIDIILLYCSLHRSVIYSWIGKYPGLAYFISQDGAYCLFCLLFVCDKNEHAVLIRKPYRDWKHATELFNAHYFDLRSDKKSSYGYATHKMCAESALTLQRVVMNAQCTVYHAVLHPHHAQSRVRVCRSFV